MKTEWKLSHRRAVEHAEMIYLLSLPLTPQDRLRYLRGGGRRKNAHALRARPDRFKELERGVRSFPFLPPARHRELRRGRRVSAEKEKTFFSAISVSLAKRAVRHRSIHVTAKLDTNVKILAYIDIE
jgi:hypothetical protein